MEKESSADKQLVERRPPEERKSVEGEAGKHCKANQPGVEEAIFCIVLRCDWSVACEHPARLDVTKLQTQISCLLLWSQSIRRKGDVQTVWTTVSAVEETREDCWRPERRTKLRCSQDIKRDHKRCPDRPVSVQDFE